MSVLHNGSRGGFWGLVEQKGPWKTTQTDIERSHQYKPNKNTGGGIQIGGTKNAGHAGWYASMNPHVDPNYSLPPPKPSAYVQKSIITAPVMMTKGPRGTVLRNSPIETIKTESVGVQKAGNRTQQHFQLGEEEQPLGQNQNVLNSNGNLESPSEYGTATSGSREFLTPNGKDPLWSPWPQSPEYQTMLPSEGSSQYGTPTTGTSQYGTPISASTEYGTATTGTSQYGTPTGKDQLWSPWPHLPRYQTMLPSEGSSQYGTPTTGTSQYGTPISASTEYGTPISASTQYGTPISASTQYGTPTSGTSHYGTPLSGSRPNRPPRLDIRNIYPSIPSIPSTPSPYDPLTPSVVYPVVAYPSVPSPYAPSPVSEYLPPRGQGTQTSNSMTGQGTQTSNNMTGQGTQTSNNTTSQNVGTSPRGTTGQGTQTSNNTTDQNVGTMYPWSEIVQEFDTFREQWEATSELLNAEQRLTAAQAQEIQRLNQQSHQIDVMMTQMFDQAFPGKDWRSLVDQNRSLPENLEMMWHTFSNDPELMRSIAKRMLNLTEKLKEVKDQASSTIQAIQVKNQGTSPKRRGPKPPPIRTNFSATSSDPNTSGSSYRPSGTPSDDSSKSNYMDIDEPRRNIRRRVRNAKKQFQ